MPPLTPQVSIAAMIPPRVYEICRNGISVSSELAKNPTEAPSIICERIFPVNGKAKPATNGAGHIDTKSNSAGEKSELEAASNCGNWGSSKPSQLFLQVNLSIQQPLNGRS